MSWDVSFYFSSTSPPPVDEMPSDWEWDTELSAEAVRAHISSLFPETEWRDPTWGSYDADGFSLTFNMGKESIKNHFMVHVYGGGDPASALTKLAKTTGWYALDTTEGEWFHHSGSTGHGWNQFRTYRDHVLSFRALN